MRQVIVQAFKIRREDGVVLRAKNEESMVDALALLDYERARGYDARLEAVLDDSVENRITTQRDSQE